MATKAAFADSSSRRFIVSSLVFILFLCAIASINEVRFAAVRNIKCAFTGNPASEISPALLLQPASNSSSDDDDDLRILIGIMTLPDQYMRRNFLRLVYGTQSVTNARIDIKFVFCNLTKEEQRVWVVLEIMKYDDIIILNCTENMNRGKTYTYFSSLPEMFNDSDRPYPPYHYVMKGDDDIYFRLENLAESLKPLPREDLYYGFVIPCNSMDPFKHYMAGMGFAVSWDIVRWVRDSDIPRSHLVGPEDKVFGDWMKMGRRGRNRHNAKWSMYNFPEPPNLQCTHEFWPETVAVHLLKNERRWIKTLQYFNATSNLRPSKLYHVS
ncbi:uncharacterized protein LOC116199153 [Punica granatum]|uniref:Hexosyltransferase n=2 Tax=Punica granatum TaxID=22663 RepID=A0A218W0Y6_PUNGR|nr:uncharacterized protein LOC116199153 [Punica granatum]OWM65782.1 hypothetical protein CDL15_Pgr015207 [Punica granatum]PKI62357.1 hypothetical protein CRG98_017163 [Punica granatum]